jgi:hypothetical protein
MSTSISMPPYRALRVVLTVFAALFAVGGLLTIAGNRSLIVWLFLRPPDSEVSTLLLFMLKELGGIALMLSMMLAFAARDPVRNVAIIDAFIVGLVVLAITPLVSLVTLDVERLYPAWMIWSRSVVRLVLAALLFWLRPRTERPRAAEHARAA